MKLFFSRLITFAFAAFLVLACTSQPAKAPPPSAMVADLVQQTVALYQQDGMMPRCTAVWVGPRRILTAAHCMSDDPTDPVYYSTISDHKGTFRVPTKIRTMALVRADLRKDLALYESGPDTPAHATVMFALSSPPVGSGLHFMGHTRGLDWSYKYGWVSAYRESDFRPVEDEKDGPWLQVSAPINHGDSGGAAFNSQGELVGLASFMIGSVPHTCFYIHLTNIRKFMGLEK